MRFTIAQPDFIEVLNRVLPAVPSKSTLPVLSNVLLQLEGKKLRLVATDLEMSVLTELEVEPGEDGSLAVPARKIGEIIRELEGLEVEFAADEANQLVLKAGAGEYVIPGISAMEYPSLPDFDGAAKFSISARKLDSIIQRTTFAVSRDELRPSLTGVFFQVRDFDLRTVSTDGHRLIRIIQKDFRYEGEPRELIIPVKTLEVVRKNIPEEGDVTFVIGDNQIMLTLGTATVYSRLIEGKYPHYESVIPQDVKEKMTVNTDALVSMVRKAQIFAHPLSRQVVFEISDNQLQVSAEDVEMGGKGTDRVEVVYEGEKKVIGYNASYILELLKHVETEEVRFEFGGQKEAGMLSPTEQKEGEDFLMLLMPVRLK